MFSSETPLLFQKTESQAMARTTFLGYSFMSLSLCAYQNYDTWLHLLLPITLLSIQEFLRSKMPQSCSLAHKLSSFSEKKYVNNSEELIMFLGWMSEFSESEIHRHTHIYRDKHRETHTPHIQTHHTHKHMQIERGLGGCVLLFTIPLLQSPECWI